MHPFEQVAVTVWHSLSRADKAIAILIATLLVLAILIGLAS